MHIKILTPFSFLKSFSFSNEKFYTGNFYLLSIMVLLGSIYEILALFRGFVLLYTCHWSYYYNLSTQIL